MSFTGKWSKGFAGKWEADTWNGTRDPSTPATGGMIPHQFFINRVLGDKQYLNISINTSNQNDEYEQIENLSVKTLDTINRFVRLAQSLGWAYSNLDWVLTSLKATEVDDSTITNLSKIKKLIDEYNLPLELLPALWFDIKTIGVGTGEYSEAPFDVIFNNSDLIKYAANSRAYHPKISDAGTSYPNPLYQDDLLNWIVSNTQFEQFKKDKLKANKEGDIPLETNLQKANAIVASIPASGNDIAAVAIAAFGNVASIELSVPNLSLLYRHTMLPKQLGMRVPEYVVLLHLLGMTINSNGVTVIKPILTPDEVLRVADTIGWIRDSGLSIYDIDYICNQTPSVYVNTGYDAKNIPSLLSSLQPVLQASLLQKGDFVYKEITQTASEAYYHSLLQQGFINNFGLIVKVIDNTTQLDFSGISPEPPSSDQLNYILTKLAKQQEEQLERFAEQLGSFFGVKAEFIAVLIDGVKNWLNDPNALEHFVSTTGQIPPIPDTVTAFLLSISQYLVMKQRLGLSIAELSSVFLSSKAYGINTASTPVRLTLSNIRDIYYVKRLIAAFGDRKNDLVNYFAKVLNNNPPANLSTITGWNQEQCDHLCQKLFGETKACNTVEKMYQLKQIFDISEALGVDVYFLEQIEQLNSPATAAATSANWESYTNLASQLLQSVKAKTTSEAWPTTYTQLNDPLEEQKRNALLGIAIWQLGQQYEDIRNPRNLYEYLLIDVEIGGCAEISYVKEALNAAQLYLQRCRLNLERNVTISTDDIPDVWWEWLMNYRVWEANRQTFLYPENYIDPTLRKSKTSLFQELENTLLQGEVTKEKVEEAYTTYLDKFAQLAKLKYIDAYHATVHNKEKGAIDTLFLFARTQEEPYNFYYIAREKAANCDNQDAYLWTEWNKIDISINAKVITPVYAYNKLLVFWVELSQKVQLEENNKKSTITSATIKYSFYNFSGKWIQPQTLLSDQIISIKSSEDIYGPFSPGLFDQEALYWHKVTVITLNNDNFQNELKPDDLGQKLCIYYGPLIGINENISSYNNFKPTNENTDDFQQTIIEAVAQDKLMDLAQQNGYFLINPAITVDAELEHSF